MLFETAALLTQLLIALNKGVNFLSESIIFTIGGGIIIVEYRRGEQKNLEKAIASAAKEKAKDEVLNARFHALEERIVSLESILSEERKVTRLKVEDLSIHSI